VTTYQATERPAPRRPEVLEHEVALLRRLLRAAERKLEMADSLLAAERAANEALRADLASALEAVAWSPRAAGRGAEEPSGASTRSECPGREGARAGAGSRHGTEGGSTAPALITHRRLAS